MKVSSADARAWLDRMISAWNRHDAAGVAACYAPDATILTVGESEPLQGLDALVETLEVLFAGFPDIQHDIRATVTEGNCLVMEWLLHGTHTGVLPSPTGFLPASGRRVEIPGVSLIWLNEHGLAHLEHSYTDPTTMARQLGLYHDHDDHTGHDHDVTSDFDLDSDDPDSGYGR